MEINENVLIKTVESKGDVVNIEFDNQEKVTHIHFWLRDHCRCAECYNAQTFQRAKHLLDIPECRTQDITSDGKTLTIIWEDNHVSIYTANFLRGNRPSRTRQLPPQLWGSAAAITSRVAHVSRDDFLHNESAERQVLESLLTNGVAFVEKVEPTVEDTEKVCRRLGPVQQTVFGGMWKFTSDLSRADTAYTTLRLAGHTDNTYFTEAAGLQILHCLEHQNGSGGETILVDAFQGATKLGEEHPEDFELLTKHLVEAEYVEDGYHHKYSAPVIKLNSVTKELEQIRWNVYDRSRMSFAGPSEARAMYGALRRLAAIYEDKNTHWVFKLNPGTVMLFDNFRLLHGREAFTGARTLAGCYIGRGDWLSRARVLALLQ